MRVDSQSINAKVTPPFEFGTLVPSSPSTLEFQVTVSSLLGMLSSVAVPSRITIVPVFPWFDVGAVISQLVQYY